MKRALLLAGLLALAACSQAPVTPDETVALTAQRLNTPADDRVVDVALHRGQGAVYTLSNTVRTLDDGSYSGDAYLNRYRRDGTLAWQRQLGPKGSASAEVLATDAGGNVYVSYNDRLEKRRADGSLVWSRTVQGVTALETDSNGSVYVGGGDEIDDAYLRKYTEAGSLLWTRILVPTRGIAAYPTGITTDASGNVYAAVRDVDDCCLWNTLVKYNGSGQRLFSRSFTVGGDNFDNAFSMESVVVQGNALYVAGTFHSNWEGEPDRPYLVDGLLIKTSLSGAEQWRRVVGTPEYDSVSDLAADSSGGLYLTGHTFGSFGSVQMGGADVFFRKYSSSGQALWTKQIGSPGDDHGNAVAAYGSGELYLAGEAGGALLGGTHRGGQDAFVRRTDGNGNRVWTDQ